MDKFSPEIHESDFNGDSRKKIEAEPYRDETELIDSSKRLGEIVRMKKDTSAEIYRLKNLVASGGRQMESQKDIEEDLVKITRTMEALEEEESEVRRNLPELN